MKRDSLYCLLFLLLTFHSAVASDESNTTGWDLEQPPGPHSQQSIDTDEGTWINLDVSPDGTELVFAIFTADKRARAAISRAERERPKGAKSWNRRAKQLQQSLIERWSRVYGS